ncbi:MAG: nitroreductase family protein [Candidatus Omnitrophica bacterium]|jgi:nitroreductase|nr:nitroreductase family protein [Candidatus Omnitrophota bacterium]
MKPDISLYDLILSRRSIRLFKQKKISLSIVRKAINAARLSPSAANLQFIEYLVIKNKSAREKISSHIRWANYIWPKRVPNKNQEPSLYILILVNLKKSPTPDKRDIGAAAENLILTFLSYGIGTCWIASIDKKALKVFFKIPDCYELDSLIAAGFPAESPKLESNSLNIRYWLDSKNILHLPKRPLKDVLHLEKLEGEN